MILGRKRRAKIIATLGPSSNDLGTIRKLIRAGVNVVRINMSHSTHADHERLIQLVREASKLEGWEVAILIDLQGPKIRVDKLSSPLILNKGETWFIGVEKNRGDHKNFIPTTYKNLVTDAKAGDRILFDDGLMEAKAINIDGKVLEIEIVDGGELKSNKGINLPGVNVSAPCLTEKDIEDLKFGIEQEADYVALSFVRKASDVIEAKKLIAEFGGSQPVISKIEKPEALDNIDEIIKESDLIMIARGDMGVEVGNHLVPKIQKDLIEKCNHLGVPVVTATQMLESMMSNPRPTRAEATDVANAVWDGTDILMLSGESAAGKYPVEAVEMMGKLIWEAEARPKVRGLLRNMEVKDPIAALSVAASMIAEKIGAKWILSVSEGGNSPLKISRFRPENPVFGVASNLKVTRKLCMYWGITPFYVHSDGKSLSELSDEALEKLKNESLIKSGDQVVIIHGSGDSFEKQTEQSVRVISID